MSRRLLTPLLVSFLSLAGLQAAIPGGDALAGLIIGEFDTNSDSSLDIGEWQRGLEDSFSSLDANSDGSISQEEVDAMKGEIAGKTGDLAAALVVALVKQLILALDTDGDKLVTLKEYSRMSDDTFKKLDTDDSKSLSRAELAELPLLLIKK